jgi:nitrous oxide reductase accessory protein NosL
MKAVLAATLMVPVVLAACQRTPPPPPAPVQTAAEAACAARAAEVAGVDAGLVTVVPTASTKTGATIYTASVGDTDYTCVVEFDQTVSTFEVIGVAG